MWTVAGKIGPHSEASFDGHGWLWELHRGEGTTAEDRRVFVQVSGSAFRIHELDGPGLAPQTVTAIETEGQSEVERVAQLDDPPRQVHCSTSGCDDIPA